MATLSDAAEQAKENDVLVSTPVAEDFHHGIPTAIFFEDIPEVVGKHTAPILIDKLSNLSQRYRFFEEKLVKSRDSLEEKVAEVRRALKAVQSLAERSSRAGENAKDIETHFELSDGIYAKARIPPTNKVCLWLGANVMVEYSHEEAKSLLAKNLANVEKSYDETCSDISYLRDQLNTTDVNLSRVYNHHVQTMRSAPKNSKSAKTGVSAPLQAK
ncbi:Prefoldin [Gracilaria domingensis]|nr:Prefoldin [Gracilaria domingensis]